jgi:hypothetical protein
MIDDILDEISMIKRVTESQDQVLLQIEQLKERRESSESPEEDTAWYGFKKPLREQCNDLERLEEDAKRVRKSVRAFRAPQSNEAAMMAVLTEMLGDDFTRTPTATSEHGERSEPQRAVGDPLPTIEDSLHLYGCYGRICKQTTSTRVSQY